MKAAIPPPLAAGPIPALIQFYERLERDPRVQVAPYGYSVQRISIAVVLNPDGSLHTIQDAREPDDRGNPRSINEIVPGMSKPTGQGINPCFLWDNMAYMLGHKPDDPKPERTAESFSEFRRLHLEHESAIDDPQFSIVCRFLEKWNPSDIATVENIEELTTGFGVFRIRASAGYVHQNETIKQWWDGYHEKKTREEQNEALSLISGKPEPIARLHEPKIKGVAGAQSAGALLVAFNADAYESYGKSQSYNAPVGEVDSFHYCTALNYLLNSRSHRIGLGDATVVFWAGQESGAAAEIILSSIFAESADDSGDEETSGEAAEHTATRTRVMKFLSAARKGNLHEVIDSPDTPFYILGLSPNAARLSIRFWLHGTVRYFSEQLARHVEDLEVVGTRVDDPPLVILGLIKEVMPEADSESQKKYVANLAGEFIRAVLTGQPYPHSIFDALLRRIRIQKEINPRRAAMLKAYLNRNRPNLSEEEKITVALNPDHPDPVYHLGRLFAALEKTQEDVTGGKLNAGIKQKYFTSASSMPASVMPRVIELHQHHLKKIENIGWRIAREKVVGKIMEKIDGFPRHLTLEKQGLFQIGYYHQRQDFFTAKPKDATETEIESETIKNEGE